MLPSALQVESAELSREGDPARAGFSLVDVDGLSFGPGAASLVFPPRFDDVNGDGARELVTRYRIRDSGLAVGDTDACLSGEVGGAPARPATPS